MREKLLQTRQSRILCTNQRVASPKVPRCHDIGIARGHAQIVIHDPSRRPDIHHSDLTAANRSKLAPSHRPTVRKAQSQRRSVDSTRLEMLAAVRGASQLVCPLKVSVGRIVDFGLDRINETEQADKPEIAVETANRILPRERSIPLRSKLKEGLSIPPIHLHRPHQLAFAKAHRYRDLRQLRVVAMRRWHNDRAGFRRIVDLQRGPNRIPRG